MTTLCEGLTKRRSRCLARAMPNSPFCETHDPTGDGLRAQIRRSKPARYRAWVEQHNTNTTGRERK